MTNRIEYIVNMLEFNLSLIDWAKRDCEFALEELKKLRDENRRDIEHTKQFIENL